MASSLVGTITSARGAAGPRRGRPAGPRRAYHVVIGQGDGQGQGLNGERGRDAGRCQGGADRLGDAELGEFRGVGVGYRFEIGICFVCYKVLRSQDCCLRW
jgi:hypothetical protein